MITTHTAWVVRVGDRVHGPFTSEAAAESFWRPRHLDGHAGGVAPLHAPTPPDPGLVVINCDNCGGVVGESLARYSFDVLGLDWAHCARCTHRVPGPKPQYTRGEVQRIADWTEAGHDLDAHDGDDGEALTGRYRRECPLCVENGP